MLSQWVKWLLLWSGTRHCHCRVWECTNAVSVHVVVLTRLYSTSSPTVYSRCCLMNVQVQELYANVFTCCCFTQTYSNLIWWRTNSPRNGQVQLVRCVCRSCPGHWSLLEDRDNGGFPVRYWEWPPESILPHSHTVFPLSRSTSCVPRPPPLPATSSTLSNKYCRCCKSFCMKMLHWAYPSLCPDNYYSALLYSSVRMSVLMWPSISAFSFPMPTSPGPPGSSFCPAMPWTLRACPVCS